MSETRAFHLDQRPSNYWDPVLETKIPLLGQAPGFGGGSYLPDLLRDEVEIAAICLNSATGDVISVRVRPVPGGLRYRVVDEYGTRFRVRHPVRGGPLSLGELVELIDALPYAGQVGLIEGILTIEWEASEGKSPGHIRRFVRVVSAYYRELRRLYRERAEAWVQQIVLERDRRQWAEWTGGTLPPRLSVGLAESAEREQDHPGQDADARAGEDDQAEAQ
jgi:hypothetical protein